MSSPAKLLMNMEVEKKRINLYFPRVRVNDNEVKQEPRCWLTSIWSIRSQFYLHGYFGQWFEPFWHCAAVLPG